MLQLVSRLEQVDLHPGRDGGGDPGPGVQPRPGQGRGLEGGAGGRSARQLSLPAVRLRRILGLSRSSQVRHSLLV